MLQQPEVLVVDDCRGTDAGQFLEHGRRGGSFGVDDEDVRLGIEGTGAAEPRVGAECDESRQSCDAGFAPHNGDIAMGRIRHDAHGSDGCVIGYEHEVVDALIEELPCEGRCLATGQAGHN